MEQSPAAFPFPWMARLQALDQRAFHRIFRPQAPPAFHRLMRAFSRSADGWWYPLAFLPGVFQPGPARAATLAALLAFALERLCYRVLKRGLRRPRPCHHLAGVRHLLAPPDEFSFPSGHTAAATVMALLLVAQFPAAAPALLLWVAGVGVSRVALGVHYPADVLAGSLLGSLCAQTALRLLPLCPSP